MLARCADQRPASMPWSIPWKPRIHLGLFVHRVRGYRPASTHSLAIRTRSRRSGPSCEVTSFAPGRHCPSGLPLYLSKEGDCHALAASVSCGQDIAETEPSAWNDRRLHGRLVTRCGLLSNLFWKPGWLVKCCISKQRRQVSIDRHRLLFDDPVHEVSARLPRLARASTITVGAGVRTCGSQPCRLWPREGNLQPNGCRATELRRGRSLAIHLAATAMEATIVAQASSLRHAGGTVAPRAGGHEPGRRPAAVFHSRRHSSRRKPTRATPRHPREDNLIGWQGHLRPVCEDDSCFPGTFLDDGSRTTSGSR